LGVSNVWLTHFVPRLMGGLPFRGPGYWSETATLPFQPRRLRRNVLDLPPGGVPPGITHMSRPSINIVFTFPIIALEGGGGGN